MVRGRKSEKKNEPAAASQTSVECKESFDKNRFLILPNSLIKNDKHVGEFIKLRHPRTGDLAMFVYTESDNKLAQLRSLPFNHRSFFSGNDVIPIDRIDFVTPVDPLFLFLPYFVKCSSMFSPLDQILVDEEVSELNIQLLKLSKSVDIQLIATKKEINDMILWQYSQSKTLEWVSPKVDRISDVLISQQINVNPNAAISSNFKISDTTIDPSEEQYKRYSYNIISEYLPVEIQKSLLKHLGLPEKVENIKRKYEVNGNDQKKKVKLNEVQYDEMPNKIEKTVVPKLTAKDKALKKAASGTKSISSFFKKT